ncbi:hypothetical protein CLU79DRAFT_690787, partial [Phycomyces nitens]
KQQIKPYKSHSNEHKLVFVYYNRVKLFDVANSGRLSGRLSRRHHKSGLRNSKKTKTGMSLKTKPTKRHKIHLVNLYDDNPQNDSTKISKSIAWVEERNKTDMDYLENWIFVDESGLDINTRHSGGWSTKDTPVIVTKSGNRAESHTILGAASAKYVVSMERWNPREH